MMFVSASLKLKSILKFVYLNLIKPVFTFFVLLPFIPIILLLRMIRPFIWIRFGIIGSKVLGNSAIDLETLMCMNQPEQSDKVDYYCFQTKKQPNEQWAQMVRRCLKVHPVVEFFYRANKLIPGGNAHQINGFQEGRHGFVYRSALNQASHPRIKFTEEENNRGDIFLKKIGLHQDDRFVCLIVRDSGYKKQYQNQSGKDWSYHNYRDSDIGTYRQAAAELTEKGYWVFRMGKGVKEPFNTDNPRIVDYANSAHRCDFLDIWLMANCYFTISTGCGLDAISEIFHRPIVFVNYPVTGLIHSYLGSQITITKKIRHIPSKNYVGLNDQIRIGSLFFMKSDLFDQNGLEVIDNSPEEITEAVLEMEERLNDTWDKEKDNDQLQHKFWEILKSWENYPENFPTEVYRKFFGCHEVIRSKMGNAFVSENQEWLLK